MPKKFLAVSAVVLCVLVAPRRSHADSIHSPDIQLDSPAGFSISLRLDTPVDAQVFDDHFTFHAANSIEAPVSPGLLEAMGLSDLFLTPDRAWGLPLASHLVRRIETDGPGTKSGDQGPTSVPEPGSALLASMAMLALAVFMRSNRTKPPISPNSP